MTVILQKIDKYLNEYYIDGLPETEDEVDLICRNLRLKNYRIERDLSVSVKGPVNLKGLKLKKLPILFNTVTRDFDCSDNVLISLEGAPKKIGGRFICNNNNLISLENSPKIVSQSFICNNNMLITLRGCPKEIGGDFNCEHNNLKSLEYGPRKIIGNYFCSYNKLKSLYGSPPIVETFNCNNNLLETLDGIPTIIKYIFNCSNNKVKFTEDDVKNLTDVKDKIIV